MFTFSPLGPVPQPSGQVHRRFPLEDSSPLQTCTSGLSLSSAFQKFFSLSTAISPFPFHPSGCGHRFIHTVVFPGLITRPPCCQPCLPIVSPTTAPSLPRKGLPYPTSIEWASSRTWLYFCPRVAHIPDRVSF